MKLLQKWRHRTSFFGFRILLSINWIGLLNAIWKPARRLTHQLTVIDYLQVTDFTVTLLHRLLDYEVRLFAVARTGVKMLHAVVRRLIIVRLILQVYTVEQDVWAGAAKCFPLPNSFSIDGGKLQSVNRHERLSMTTRENIYLKIR